MSSRIFFSLALVFSIFGISKAQIIISATGSNNNFSVTYPANFSVLPTGLEFTFFANHTISTGGVTLNVNGLGALPIVKNVNQPLSAGEITTNQAVKVVYSTLNNWQMVSAAPSSSQDWTMLGNTPDSNSNYLGTNNLQPLLFYTNGVERMRISRQGRFGFNMNISSAALMNIKSQGTGPTISIFRSSDSNPIMEFRESGGGNGRIDLYNGGNLNTVQIPSGNGNIFFAGGGNFGIGTTSPGNNLHVIGGGRFTNLSSSGISFVQADNLGNLQITTNTGFLGGTGIQNQLAFFSSANTLTSTGNMFYTPASSSLSLGVISLANGFGSFAIGSNVSVSGARSLGIGNFINITNLGNVALGDWSSSTPSILTSGSDDQFLARFANGYHLYTRSNLSDGVFINSLGQGGLGIGSSSATHRLNVSATIIAGAENLARFVVPDATGNYLDVLNGNPTAGTFLPKIQSNTVGLSSGLVLESLQNNDVSSHPSLIVVNSGFTSPTNPFVARQLFEIQNGTQLRFRVSSDGTTRIASLTSSGNNFVQANSLGDLFITTNSGATAWTISGSNIFPQNLANKVGIGTISPTSTLHLNGSLALGQNGSTRSVGTSSYALVISNETYVKLLPSINSTISNISNGSTTGQLLLLENVSTTGNNRILIPNTSATNVSLTSDITLQPSRTLTLLWNGNDWIEVGNSKPSVSFSAYATAVQTITGGTITFAAENYDIGNAFANSTFTAPVDGVYHFDCALRCEDTQVNSYVWVGIYKNGALQKANTSFTAPTAGIDFTQNISVDLRLVTGDAITIVGFESSTGVVRTVIPSSVNVWFSGHLVSPD